jgi:hypothetical protein
LQELKKVSLYSHFSRTTGLISYYCIFKDKGPFFLEYQKVLLISFNHSSFENQIILTQLMLDHAFGDELSQFPSDIISLFLTN